MADTQSQVVKLDVPEKISIEFQLDDRLIDGVIVRPIMFAAFVDAINETTSMRHPTTFEAKVKRNRMHRQATFYTGNSVAQVSKDELARLPISVARTILDRISKMDDEAPAGKINREGNGVDQAVVFELGTPIPGRPNSIKELEFFAKTYGDIEDVMAANTGLVQTITMLKTIAKPLGTSLMTLPSWGVNQITMEDGYAIMLNVLPLFLGSPEAS